MARDRLLHRDVREEVCKFTAEYATKAQRESRVVAVLSL
jgi:hypothetical protein